MSIPFGFVVSCLMTINLIIMGLEYEPSSIEADLEVFREDLDDAGNFAIEFGARTSVHDLPSFEALVDNKEAMLEALMQKFGINPQVDQPSKEYVMSGTPGDPDEGEEDVGEVKVRVFATNNPEVFLGQYSYAGGEVDWAIRPLEFEE